MPLPVLRDQEVSYTTQMRSQNAKNVLECYSIELAFNALFTQDAHLKLLTELLLEYTTNPSYYYLESYIHLKSWAKYCWHVKTIGNFRDRGRLDGIFPPDFQDMESNAVKTNIHTIEC